MVLSQCFGILIWTASLCRSRSGSEKEVFANLLRALACRHSRISWSEEKSLVKEEMLSSEIYSIALLASLIYHEARGANLEGSLFCPN